MIKTTRTVEGVKVGEALPLLQKTFTTADLVAYGAATWDWHRVHYDVDFARGMKLPAVIVDGQTFGALFARVALDWAGPRAFLVRLSFKMKSMAFAGDTLCAEGEVLDVRDHTVVLAQRLIGNGRLVAEATSEVKLPAAMAT